MKNYKMNHRSVFS